MAATGGGAPVASPAVRFAAAASTATPPASTTSITTYLKKYTTMPDVLNKDYDSLYGKASLLSSSTPEELLEHFTSTRNVIPKVFLALLESNDKKPLMTLIHRPFKYPQHPTTASPWDDKSFCFIGDIMRGNNMVTRVLPAEAFEVTDVHKVPTVATVDALLAALPATDDYLPLPSRTAATDEIRSRYLVQIPHCYLAQAFDLAKRGATPQIWWKELSTLIKTDKKEKELQLLYDFLRLSCVRQSNDVTGDRDPGSMFGTKEGLFPPLDIDSDLNDIIHEVIVQDLPALNPTIPSVDTTGGLVTVMREEGALHRAQREQERREQDTKEAARKLPSYVFPNTHTKWMRNCSATVEADLEPFYIRWAAIKQGERRAELQNHVDTRSLEDASAGKRAPIVTKELYEMTAKGCLGSRDIDILTQGVSPFTCGFVDGTRPEVTSRMSDFDIAMQGRTTPTVAEQQRFSTKEVPLPTTTYHAGAMMKATSIFLDIVQGPNDPHALKFRRFCIDDWPDIEDDLQKTGEPNTVGNVLPSICRTVQIKMVTYLQELSDGRSPMLPTYSEIRHFVQRHEWYKLQPIPQRYAIIREEKPPRREPTPAGVAETQGSTAGKRKTLGDSANNGDVNAEWKEAFAATGKALNEFRKKVPKTMDESQNPPTTIEMCLSWHFRGWCFRGCERCSTHRPLSTSERKDMDAFVKNELKKE